jgi:sugar (pentulose or hexulose) kinase
MPPFVEVGYCCGLLLPEQSEILGLPKNLPVYCGGPDFVMAIIGSGTNSVGDIVDRCGTSEGINICIDKLVRYNNQRKRARNLVKIDCLIATVRL